MKHPARAANVLGTTVLVLLLAAIADTQIADCIDCDDRGGVYVRGTLWYECVERR